MKGNNFICFQPWSYFFSPIYRQSTALMTGLVFITLKDIPDGPFPRAQTWWTRAWLSHWPALTAHPLFHCV